MTAKIVAGAYLVILLVAFLVWMVELNGLVTVLQAIGGIGLCVSVFVSLVVLMENDATN